MSPRRVRALIAAGDLEAERIGRSWAIDRRQPALGQDRRPGRRWNPQAAWALIARAAGVERPSDCSRVDWSRAGRRLREEGLLSHLPRLASRAAVHHFYAHPSIVTRLADDPRVLPSGVSAASHVGADLIALDEFEGYVLEGEAPEFIRRQGLVLSDDPNVLLRVLPAPDWPIPPADGVAHPLLVAVDLWESDDERARRAGRKLLERFAP